jgi:hypothetical protein
MEQLTPTSYLVLGLLPRGGDDRPFLVLPARSAVGVAMSSIPSPSSTPALGDDGAYLAALPNPQVGHEEVGDEARGIEGIGGATG